MVQVQGKEQIRTVLTWLQKRSDVLEAYCSAK